MLTWPDCSFYSCVIYSCTVWKYIQIRIQCTEGLIEQCNTLFTWCCLLCLGTRNNVWYMYVSIQICLYKLGAPHSPCFPSFQTTFLYLYRPIKWIHREQEACLSKKFLPIYVEFKVESKRTLLLRKQIDSRRIELAS